MALAQTDNAQHFRAEWARYHANSPPLPWLLRQRPLPWLRFHGLPKSKQYPDSKYERSIILDRANAIASELLGDGAQCWLIDAGIAEDAPDEVAFEWTDPDDPDDPPLWQFSAQPVTWQRNAFDIRLAARAEDDGWPVMWMARHSGAIFAPYDGGFDLFPASWPQVKALRDKWPEWLPMHPNLGSDVPLSKPDGA